MFTELIKLRKDLGYTQEEIDGLLFDGKRGTMCRIENGLQDALVVDCVKLSGLLKRSVKFLFPNKVVMEVHERIMEKRARR